MADPSDQLTPIQTAADVVKQGLAVWDAWGASVDQFNAWMSGSFNGGPNNDGHYPLTNRGGVTVLVPCPALLASFAPVDYDGMTFSGALGQGEQLVGSVMNRSLSLPASLAGSIASARRAPSVDFAMTLMRYRNGVADTILTASVPSSSTAVTLATYGGGAISILPGDVLVPTGPATSVPSMVSLDVTLRLVPTA